MLTELLADADDNKDNPIPIAIEMPRGLLCRGARATGRPGYPFNPMEVARYRERRTVARCMCDHADAMVLANILRTDRHAHHRLPADSELARRVAACSHARTRTRLAAHEGLQRAALTPAGILPRIPGGRRRLDVRTWPARTQRYWPGHRADTSNAA